MNIAQIIILSILVLITLVSYIIVNTTKKEMKLMGVSSLWLFISGLLFTITITVIGENSKLQEQLDSKFPKLEEVKNVYKIVDK